MCDPNNRKTTTTKTKGLKDKSQNETQAIPGRHIDPDGGEEKHAVKDGGAGEKLIFELVDDDVLPVAPILHGWSEIHLVLEQRPVDLWIRG